MSYHKVLFDLHIIQLCFDMDLYLHTTRSLLDADQFCVSFVYMSSIVGKQGEYFT